MIENFTFRPTSAHSAIVEAPQSLSVAEVECEANRLRAVYGKIKLPLTALPDPMPMDGDRLKWTMLT